MTDQGKFCNVQETLVLQMSVTGSVMPYSILCTYCKISLH